MRRQTRSSCSRSPMSWLWAGCAGTPSSPACGLSGSMSPILVMRSPLPPSSLPRLAAAGSAARAERPAGGPTHKRRALPLACAHGARRQAAASRAARSGFDSRLGHARYGRARKAACAEFRTENAPVVSAATISSACRPPRFIVQECDNNTRSLANHAQPLRPRRARSSSRRGRSATARRSAARDRCGRLLCARQRRSQGASSKSRLGFAWGNSHDRWPGRPDFLIAAGEVRGVGDPQQCRGCGYRPASRLAGRAQTGGGRADNASTPRAQGVQRSRGCAS